MNTVNTTTANNVAANSLTVNRVASAVNFLAPPALALPGDPAGLHSGSPDDPVKRVVLALDAGLDVVSAAAPGDMLVVHHPRFYRGLCSIRGDDPAGRRAAAIAGAGVPVYSAHTCLDVAPGGTADCLAAAAGLAETSVLHPTFTERLMKITVFVPTSHVDAVLGAMTRAGAGAIGKYSECSFRTRGTGTFRCGPGTKPFQGRPGSREEADEFRLETVAGEFSSDAVIRAMLAAHPYEEVAYDIHKLENPGTVYGLGRVGCLSASVRVDALAGSVAARTGSAMAQFAGPAGRRVRRVAVWPGAGAELDAVHASRADALITGEIGFHDLESFLDQKIAVITLGHGPSEAIVLPALARRLRPLLPGCGVTVCRGGVGGMKNVVCAVRGGKKSSEKKSGGKKTAKEIE